MHCSHCTEHNGIELKEKNTQHFCSKIINLLFFCFCFRLGTCELPLSDQWLSHTSASHVSQQSINPTLLSPRAANNNNNNTFTIQQVLVCSI